MVMEYVEGHTLDAEMKDRGRFTAAEALEILNTDHECARHSAFDGCRSS
jgi:hypothetical protein